MKKVIVCINRRANPAQPSCAERHSRQIADLLERGITEDGIGISLERFKCLGNCDHGPNLRLAPDGEFCHGVQLADVPRMLEKIRAFAAE